MNENIQKIIKNILRDIAVDMKDEFDQNFERQAFFSQTWQRRPSSWCFLLFDYIANYSPPLEVPLSKRRGEFQKGGETSRSASYGTLFLFVGSNRIYFS